MKYFPHIDVRLGARRASYPLRYSWSPINTFLELMCVAVLMKWVENVLGNDQNFDGADYRWLAINTDNKQQHVVRIYTCTSKGLQISK